MHYYWINGVYTISVVEIENQTEIPKRPAGNWTWDGTNWVRQEYTIQNALDALRDLRNLKLNQTDWRMVTDYPGTNQANWQAYRQALRDLPANCTPALDENGNLINVNWPEPPTE